MHCGGALIDAVPDCGSPLPLVGASPAGGQAMGMRPSNKGGLLRCNRQQGCLTQAAAGCRSPGGSISIIRHGILVGPGIGFEGFLQLDDLFGLLGREVVFLVRVLRDVEKLDFVLRLDHELPIAHAKRA